jgi:hypothetical protein
MLLGKKKTHTLRRIRLPSLSVTKAQPVPFFNCIIFVIIYNWLQINSGNGNQV